MSNTFKKIKQILTKKRNRFSSIYNRKKNDLKFWIRIKAIIALAFIRDKTKDKYKAQINELGRVEGEEQSLRLRLFGSVDADKSLKYANTLISLKKYSDNVDGTLAMSRSALGSQDNIDNTAERLKKHGIIPIGANDVLSLYMMDTSLGQIGVVEYNRHLSQNASNRISVDIRRCISKLRKTGAEFIIAVVNTPSRRSKTSRREQRLFKTIAFLGADYILGVRPNLREGGTTFENDKNNVVRCVYSIGAFLVEGRNFSKRRIALELHIEKRNGKIEVAKEYYLPFYNRNNGSFVPLLKAPKSVLSSKLKLQHIKSMRKEMGRLRSADKAITYGELFYAMYEELPARFKYLENRTVGRITSRSFEVNPGDIFFFRPAFDDANDQIKTGRVNRRRVAAAAGRRGAELIVSYEPIHNLPCVVVDDVTEAHIAACRYIRDRLPMRTIGITGSIGKTSTKDMLAEVLGMKYRTEKSLNNENTQVKIGVKLQNLDERCQFFIQEIGGGRPGGASRHSRMVGPEIAIITNIGDAHLGNFHGNQRKLMRNKLGIAEGMGPKGVLFLNGDDPLLFGAKVDRKVVYYAVENHKADYYADNIYEVGNKTYFTIVRGKHKVNARINVLGRHNVLNAVCCYAVGRKLNIPEKQIIKGLLKFKTTGIRQNIVKVAGMKLMMDCFNASSDSVKTSLDTFEKLNVEEGRKIVVLGDLTGLGERTKEAHLEMAEQVMAHNNDKVILYGKETELTYNKLISSGFECEHIDKHKELVDYLKANLNPGDAALFKGSSKMRLELCVDEAFGTRMTDKILIAGAQARKIAKSDIAYNLFTNYATAIRPVKKGVSKLTIPSYVDSFKITNIGAKFGVKSLEEIDISDSVRHIGIGAFKNCGNLTKVSGCGGIQYIGNSAFEGCEELRNIEFPNTLIHIGKRAFANCISVETVYLPKSISFIGKDAFKDCYATFRCDAGSYAEEYLTKNKIKHEVA